MGRVGVSSDSRSEHDNEIDDEVEYEVDDEVGKKGWNLSKSKKIESGFLTSRARMTFTKLRQAFIKALIFYHFNPEYHIWVETDVSGYAIDGILSQLTLDNSSQWHPIAFFF